MYDKVKGFSCSDELSMPPFNTSASNIVSLLTAAWGNWETGSVLFEAIASSFDAAAWKDDFSRTCVTSEPRVVAADRAARGGRKLCPGISCGRIDRQASRFVLVTQTVGLTSRLAGKPPAFGAFSVGTAPCTGSNSIHLDATGNQGFSSVWVVRRA